MSHNDFNLYEELEVNKKASQEEIKKSYKRLAMVIKYITIYYKL